MRDAVEPRRGGLLLRANPAKLDVPEPPRRKPVGDFDRATDANGEADDANASNPERFVPVDDDESLSTGSVDEDDDRAFEPLADAKAENGEGEGLEPKKEVEEDVMPLLVLASGVGFKPNKDGPFAWENGEDVDA